MKKSLLTIALTGTMLLTACGSGSKSADMETSPYNFKSDNAVSGYFETDAPAEDSDSYENEDSTALSYKQSEIKAINTQMLVYSCDMGVDVLEFDQSVNKLHELINIYGGFIERENYSDGGNSSRWQYSNDQKWKTLTAVIRVPSLKYDEFCKEVENIGDLRSKNASVQNLTTEYSDLKTTLSIYEAKEQRYLDLLSELKDEQDAIRVENELTDIQVEIAKLKTRMNNIENDVAYSFINLTVNEVREYTEDPVIERTDTFGQRLKNTVAKTWDSFLYFLENLLFVIIRMLPYLLLIGLIVFIIIKLVKFFAKLAEKRNKKKYVQRVPQPIPPQPIPPQPIPPQPNNQMPQNQPANIPGNGAPHNDPPADKQ